MRAVNRLSSRSRSVLAAIGLLGLGLASGCSPSVTEAPGQAAQARATHPESGLAVIPVAITSASGKHTFRAEFAQSRLEQAKGLMFRTAMGPDEAMLFPLDPPRPASFWMRNTVIPLDILFIGRDRRVLNIHADAEPYSERPILSEGEASAVLELVGGRAAQLGIAVGDRVEW